MSIKQQGGVFGRNPTFNDVKVTEITVDGEATLSDTTKIGADIVAPSSGYALDEYSAQIANLTSAAGDVPDTDYYAPAFALYAGDVLHRGYSFSYGDRPFGYAGDLLFAGGEATRPTLGNAYSTSFGGDVTFRSGAAYGENISRATYVQGKLIFQTPTAADKTDSSYTTRMEIDGPNVALTTGTNLVVASGNGIDFSATSGTGTSELFDDYEEGTWTGKIADAASGGNESSTNINGFYVKVGKMVYVDFNVSNINTTGLTSSNDVYITGLPFTSASGSGVRYYSGTLVTSVVSFTNEPVLFLMENSTSILLSENRSGSGADFIVVSELSSGVSDIHGNLCYPAA